MGQRMAYLEAAVQNHLTRQATFTPPATVYWIASIAAFDPTLTGTSVVEPSGGGYVRVSHANDNTLWTVPAGSNPSAFNNAVEIDWPTATANWGLILAVYVGDAATGGNLLWGSAVAGGAGIPVNTGSQFAEPIGAFVVRDF
jgi:hypothetical protein